MLKYELILSIFAILSDLVDIFGCSLTSKKEGKAIKMIGTPSIQNDHLQLPNSAEMLAENSMAKKMPTVFAIVKKPMDIALSLGGNHLIIRADAGAYMQPAAKPLRNL
jgi:hypothetical protein